MLKYVFLAGAMMASAPAIAQDMPAQTTQPAPTTTEQSAPAQPPAQTAVPAQDSTVAAQPVAPTQIADVVIKEFPTYDKNGDGNLSASEFDAWMVALKTASDPSTKATAPATKTWLSQAFAQADTDKNKKVSQTELTGFLSQKG